MLYGTANSGGNAGYGTVFSINDSSRVYTNLYSFQDGPDGENPLTALFLSGNTLYGTAQGDPYLAGYPNYGTIFSISTTGTNFTVLNTFSTTGFSVLHSFNHQDGANPSSQLVLSGSIYYGIPSTVYGTTSSGGSNYYGTVFKVNTDGTGFADLYDFTGENDGKYPQTGLLISGNTLYGTTTNSIFKINTDGSDFICLTNITNASQLILSLSGYTLYGVISNGGSGYGSVFSINTDGSGFTNFYTFRGGINGEYPNSGLELYGIGNSFGNQSWVYALYGTTIAGGTNGDGIVYSINTDGSGFNNIHDFNGINDGANPIGGVVVTNNNAGATYLFGTTSTGCTNGGGTVFGMNLDGTDFQTLYCFGGETAEGTEPEGKLVFVGTTLYGTTSGGGEGTNGEVFSINYDGTDFTELFDFTGGDDGGSPIAGLTLPVVDNGWSIWSLDTTVNVSAESASNAIYSVAIDNYYTLFVNGILVNAAPYHFGQARWSPYTSLSSYLHQGENDIKVIIGGNQDDGDYFDMAIKSAFTNAMYGTTYSGGRNNSGTVFAVNSEGETNLYSFKGIMYGDGEEPIGNLVLLGTNLYGVTEYGGINGSIPGDGTVFKICTNGSGYTSLYSFGATSVDGQNPAAGLTLCGGALYGTTVNGGNYGGGTIFSIYTDGSGYKSLYSFGTINDDGTNPEDPLVLGNNNTLYGTTCYGGVSNCGTIFSFSQVPSNYMVLYNFTGSPDGANSQAGLIFAGSTLYGTTCNGGTNNGNGGNGYGTIFSFTIGSSTDIVLHSFGNIPDGANPYAGLALSGDTLYGTTYYGGTKGDGIIFSIGVNGFGVGYTRLQSFGAADTDYGMNPQAGLIISSNLLYGTTVKGGFPYGLGMVFTINTNGIGLNDIYDFTNYPGDGANPKGGVCFP